MIASAASRPDDPPSDWLYRVLLALILACGLSTCFFYTLNHDVAYLLHLAQQVLLGARLYVDVPEINPPLVVWLNLPIAWVALHTQLAPSLVFRLAVLALALASALLSARLLRAVAGRDASLAWLALALYVTMLMPAYHFGQREHLALLCSLPYLAEALRRLTGQPLALRSHLAIALLATAGLALKPHFLLVPLLVEGYAAWQTRRLAPGCLLAAAALLAYLLGVLLWLPEYLAMVRLLGGGYSVHAASWFSFMDTAYFYATAILTMMALLARPPRPLAGVLLLAVAGFALAAILQRKGWAYHWVAAMGLAWLLFGQAVLQATSGRMLRGQRMAPLIVCSLVALLSLLDLSRAVRSGQRVNPAPAQLGPVIRELGGGPVIVFSTLDVAFPLVTEAGIGSSTRFPTMTVVQAMEQGGNRAALDWIHHAFAEDFYRKPPRLLIVQVDERGEPVVDFVRFFAPDVPQLLQYRVVRRLPKFQVLQAPDNR